MMLVSFHLSWSGGGVRRVFRKPPPCASLIATPYQDVEARDKRGHDGGRRRNPFVNMEERRDPRRFRVVPVRRSLLRLERAQHQRLDRGIDRDGARENRR